MKPARSSLCTAGPLRMFKVRSMQGPRLARERRDARAHAGVPEIARSPHRPRARWGGVSSPRGMRTVVPGKAAGGPRAQRIGAAEHRRLWVGACTHALRELAHRVCSSATNEVSEASYAVRPEAEERREPVAQRRASLCAVPAARPSPCLHRQSSQRIADADQAPRRADSRSPVHASRAARSTVEQLT
jgi:hypothetical protein